MMISRKNLLFIVIVATGFISTIHAEKNTTPKRELKFELSEKPIGLPDWPSKSTYVGTFHVVQDRKFFTWIFHIPKTPKWRQMSESQKQLVTQLLDEFKATDKRSSRFGFPFSIKSDYTHTPAGMVTYRVPGVSEEDTRKMAEAVIECFDHWALSNLELHQNLLEEAQNTIAEAEKVIPKLEKEYKHLSLFGDEKIKEYSENNHGIDPKTILDHAKKNMEELSRYLRDADFELIGLQAKIDIAGKYKTVGKITDQATLIKLNQILMVDEIELAGVLARKNAYKIAIKKAKEVYDIISKREETSAQKTVWEKKLEDAKRLAANEKKFMAEAKVRPVQVHENKVIIHPVHQQ